MTSSKQVGFSSFVQHQIRSNLFLVKLLERYLSPRRGHIWISMSILWFYMVFILKSLTLKLRDKQTPVDLLLFSFVEVCGFVVFSIFCTASRSSGRIGQCSKMCLGIENELSENISQELAFAGPVWETFVSDWTQTSSTFLTWHTN